MKGSLFFIYSRKGIRWPWWQLSGHVFETTCWVARLGSQPTLSISTAYCWGSKHTGCSVLATAGLSIPVAHQANYILKKNATDVSTVRPGRQLFHARGKEQAAGCTRYHLYSIWNTSGSPWVSKESQGKETVEWVASSHLGSLDTVFSWLDLH